MDRLEQELRNALARKEPPPGFSERVSARVARRRVFMLPRWIPAAAALAVIASGGLAYRHHQGMVAKERLMQAMRITAGELNRIQTRVKEAQP